MKKFVTVLALAAIMTVGATVAVFAQAPVDGTYKSTNGDFLEGRQTTSWSAPSGRHVPGNVLHAQSWDGATLGTEWSIDCPIAVNVLLLYDFVFAGTGQIAYLITYVGGTITLDGAGPWGGGDALYSGIIDQYVETRILQYVGGVMVGTAENHSVEAHIIGYPSGCVSFGIGNGTWIGDTDASVKPANYPDYKDNACSTIGGPGRWGLFTDMTLTITGCAVPTEETSWGSIKARYHD